MARPAIRLSQKVRVKTILRQLEEQNFDGFPIVNTQMQCIGLINRHALVVLLGKVDRLPNCEKPQTDLDNGPEELDHGTGINESTYEAEGGKGETALSWEDFNVDMHSSTPSVDDRRVQQMAV